MYPISEPSTSLCKNFGKFFVEKITTLRSLLCDSVDVLHDVPLCSASTSEFERVDLISCNDIIAHYKTNYCALGTLFHLISLDK